MDTIDTSKLQDGDRFGISGSSFLSRCIKRVMRKYARGKDIPKLLGDWIPSHWGTLFCINGEWWIFESVAKGYKPNRLLGHYSAEDDFVVLRTKGRMSKQEKGFMLESALELDSHSVTYGYVILFLWLLEAYLHIDLFFIVGESMEVCYQSTYQILKWSFPERYPYDVQNVPYWYPVRNDDIIVIDNRK